MNLTLLSILMELYSHPNKDAFAIMSCAIYEFPRLIHHAQFSEDSEDMYFFVLFSVYFIYFLYDKPAQVMSGQLMQLLLPTFLRWLDSYLTDCVTTLHSDNHNCLLMLFLAIHGLLIECV